MKLIIIGIFFVACLLTNFEVESSAQNRDNVVGLLLRPTSKSSPIQRSSRPQRVLSGIERFYGTRGTRGCPRRKSLTYVHIRIQTRETRCILGITSEFFHYLLCSSDKIQTRKLFVCYIKLIFCIPYARRYNPWFEGQKRFFNEVFEKILHLFMLSIQELFVIKSGLWWRAYGNHTYLKPSQNKKGRKIFQLHLFF